ncbi:uncharacterized protein LOC109852147 [Pseudomyrmex gracilis]|uniref:uncharacterized protein LOC109852147 n=1 Tax=Pseudomyrmex gracilis TaxID=219809 RepID=UPI000995291B|nr:uncharacterized protein LOC109852147 [Pseudomyrmex gracilis]
MFLQKFVTNMRKQFDSKTKLIRKRTSDKELSEFGLKTGESERRDRSRYTTVKSLAGARWNEAEKVKDELKTLLPILTPSQVKRFYLPFHEAVIDELEENGCEKSANFLRTLFELDEKSREEAGPDTPTWRKPRLRNNKAAVTRLKEGLIASENFEKIGNSISATTELVKMAQHFQSMTWEWWYVAEQLLRCALTQAELIKDDKKQTITLVNYLYGRFLFEKS